MNAWVVKIGDSGFSENEINKILETVKDYPALAEKEQFKFDTNNIHYYSVCTKTSYGMKKYHDINRPNNTMVAFSGLLVGNGTKNYDFRDISFLTSNNLNLKDIFDITVGQYAVIRIAENIFESIVDPIGAHKVYYYNCEKSGFCYASNFLRLIKIFKNNDINYNYFAESISLKNNIGYSCEENEVYTLPEFGYLIWRPGERLQAKQTYNINRFFMTSKNPDELLYDTSIILREAANYLSCYHDSFISLSGGYDSRIVLDMFWHNLPLPRFAGH